MIYLFYFIIAFNFTLFLGVFTLKKFTNFKFNNQLSSSFYGLVLGVLIIGFLTSIALTQFKTINTLMIIPILYLGLKPNIFCNNSFKISKLISTKHVLKLNLTVLVLLTIQLLFYGGFKSPVLLPIDVNNYTEICYGLSQGLENHYGALNILQIKQYQGSSPYHYFDLWINIFFYTILPKIKLGYSLLFITYPLLLSVFFLGILKLLQKLSFGIYFKFILSIFLLFVGPISLEFIKTIFEDGNLLSSNTVIFENSGYFFNTLPFSYHGQKHLIDYVLFLLFIFVFRAKKLTLSLLVLTLICIVNIGTYPAIFGGVILFFVFKYYTSDQRKSIINSFWMPIFILFSILLYYILFSSTNNEKGLEIHTFGEYLNYKGEISRIIFRVFYPIIWFVFLYPLFLIIIKKREIAKSELFIFGVLLLAASLSTRILFQGFDSAQFLSYIFPLYNIGLILLIIKLLLIQKNRFVVLLLVLSISIINIQATIFHTQTRREIQFSKIHSENYVNTVLKELKKYKTPSIGYYIHSKNIKLLDPMLWYTDMGNEFLIPNDYLNNFSLDFTTDTSKLKAYRNHFMNYATLNKLDVTNEKTLLDFLKQNKIQYISSYSSRKLPNLFENKIDTIATDSKSGNIFLKLKF
jgi:hypothetical protein